MSSRLVILPKKSYCPWKAENIERVIQDEKKHAEEEEKRRQHEAEAISAIRSGTIGTDDNQRFSLFEEEEIKAHQAETQQEVVAKATDSKTKSGVRKNAGVAPTFLGQSAKKDVFYLKPYGDCQQEEDANAEAEPSYERIKDNVLKSRICLLYTSPSPRD